MALHRTTLAAQLLAIWAGVSTHLVQAARTFISVSDELELERASLAMPGPIASGMKLRMPVGKHISVGFEFECANKFFMLTHYLQETADSCPEIEFPLNGRSMAKPHEMLPEIFDFPNANESDLFDMDKFSMPPSVRNIVWTKDALSPEHGDECTLDEEGWLGPRKIPGQGLVPGAGDVVYNNGNCECWYTLEFKTLPLHSADDIREAMIGAALSLKEASKKEDHFKDWNVQDLFSLDTGRDKCTGSTHVTKAFVINRRSMVDMLRQQMFGFCTKHWAKESAGDKIFRTSFAEAYMLWRAMSFCREEASDDSHCKATLKLRDMCKAKWSNATVAQADVEEQLLSDPRDFEAAMGGLLHHQHLGSDSTLELRSEIPCSPGKVLRFACDAEDVDDAIFSNPEFGFGDLEDGPYYGPGGAGGRDTATKIGGMLSSDGETLFGLAEHRKDLWNSKDFRSCLYASLSRARDATHAGELFDKSPFCKAALIGATAVDYVD